jgi:hypothetical protein
LFYLIIVIFTFYLHSATDNLPHILLLQDERFGGLDFLMGQTKEDSSRRAQFYCDLPGRDMETDDPEDHFPVKYYITSLQRYNEGIYKESNKVKANYFYATFQSVYSDSKSFILAATGDHCQDLFSYLDSIKTKPDIIEKIRCIFIQHPRVSKNRKITKRYTKGLLKKLPYASIIIPLIYEFFKGTPHDAFAPDIIHYAHNISCQNSFCSIPIVITYSDNFSDDALSLHAILIRNPAFTQTADPAQSNSVVLLATKEPHFELWINNIISTYYEKDLFKKFMEQQNESLLETNKSDETNRMIEQTTWFASKTPTQRTLIRLVRDSTIVISFLGFMFGAYRVIKRLFN